MLKSDFEAMSACIFPDDPAANNKAYSNKKKKHIVSNAEISSMVGGRVQETKLDLRFHDSKEQKTLSNKDTFLLRERRLSNATEFG